MLKFMKDFILNIYNSLLLFLYKDLYGTNTLLTAYVVWLCIKIGIDPQPLFDNTYIEHENYINDLNNIWLYNTLYNHYMGPNKHVLVPEVIEPIYMTVNDCYRKSINKSLEFQFNIYFEDYKHTFPERFEKACMTKLRMSSNDLIIRDPDKHHDFLVRMQNKMYKELRYIRNTLYLDPYFRNDICNIEIHQAILTKLSENANHLNIILSDSLSSYVELLVENIIAVDESRIFRIYGTYFLDARQMVVEKSGLNIWGYFCYRITNCSLITQIQLDLYKELLGYKYNGFEHIEDTWTWLNFKLIQGW